MSYSKSVDKKLTNMGVKMEKKEKIIDLYYVEHLTSKEISDKLNISSAYITKIIKKDLRYTEEKICRLENSKQKRKISQNNFIKNKRQRLRIEDNYLILQAQHNQAINELSKRKHLTNENYRKWNISAYLYNPSKSRYEFNSTLGRSYAVPKYIKER